MSETREQFRERIGRLAYETHPHKHEEEDGYGRPVGTEVIPWEYLPQYLAYLDHAVGLHYAPSPEDVQDAAEAVYAAALRDVLSAMRHRYDDVIDTNDLIRWARERGIDL